MRKASKITHACVTLALAFVERGDLSAAEMRALVDLPADRVKAARRLLSGMGLLVEQGDGAQRRYRFVGPRRAASPARLDTGDALAVVLGSELLSFFEGTPVAAWTQGLWERLRPLIQPGHLERARELQRRFILLSEPRREYARQREALSDVIDAVTLHHELSLTYGSKHLPRFRCHALAMYRRGLYLIGDTPGDPTLLRLALDRAGRVCRHRVSFVPRPAEAIREELSRWFGIRTGTPIEPIALRFHPRVGRYVELRQWHHTERKVRRADGVIDLHLYTGGEELVRFCLEWGETVEVLAPVWLRQAVLKELKGAVALYEGAPHAGGRHEPIPSGRRPSTEGGSSDRPPPLEKSPS